MRTETEIKAIVSDVQRRLDARRVATGIGLRVPSEDGYLHADPWLSILVRPESAHVRTLDYVDELGRVQGELRREGVDHVVLVPAFVDD